jgi:transcriptional regulator with XRE-family HTH domain
MDRDALADFLRSRRTGLQPGDVGLSAGSRRRTSGLRREEVAQLAHMSTDFYTRLEQARGSRPSQQTVAAIARALRLNPFERDHLYRLAGHSAPALAFRTDHPNPGLLRVMDVIDSPAQIISDIGVTLSQNRLAELLVGDTTRFSGLERSMIYRWFVQPEARAIHPEDEYPLHSHGFVGMLRAAQSRSPSDPEVLELVGGLMEQSDEFRELWALHEVGTRQGTIKRFIHPLIGTITLDCQILSSMNYAENLVVFTAMPGSEDAERLALLAVVGGQTFS